MENNTENNTPNPNKRGLITSAIWLLITVVMVFAFVYTLKMDTKVTNDEYYQIVNYFDQNKVKEYSLNLSSRKLTYVLRGEKEARSYTVPNVQLFVQDVHETVRDYNKAHPNSTIKMNYEAGASTSWVAEIVPMVIITLLLCLAFYWLMKKMNNTMMGENNRTMAFGKARLKSGDDEQRKTTFDDVAGVDEEKEDLQEIVEFLRNPEKFRDLGARIPKGVLLVGPPGTGKTLLARAVAGEADATFLSISGSDFVEMYVGVGASRVRDLFETAKKNVPSIIFIDEIDAVGRHRGAGMGGGHDEREQTLNQLLVEMDGFGANVGVIIIAATNRPDILDPALLRPGRFDRQVTVNYPDVNGREAILKVHSKNKPIGPDVSLSEIARATSGFTGADLENLLNEAALLAARRNKRAITKADIEDATIKVVVGTEKKSKKINDDEKKLTAYHEAGHAVTNYYLSTLDPVHQISIIPRGMAGGYTMSLPKEDKSYVSKNHMLDELVTLLGGRVSEAIILGDISTGASNDIERATNIARNMITKYGMSEKLGPITYGSDNDEVFLGKNYNHMRNYSEDTASAIDKEIATIISEAYDRADEILRLHIEKLHALAAFLIRFEKIDGAVFEKLMKEENFSLEDYEKAVNEEKKSKEARKAKIAKDAEETLKTSDDDNHEDDSKDEPKDDLNNTLDEEVKEEVKEETKVEENTEPKLEPYNAKKELEEQRKETKKKNLKKKPKKNSQKADVVKETPAVVSEVVVPEATEKATKTDHKDKKSKDKKSDDKTSDSHEETDEPKEAEIVEKPIISETDVVLSDAELALKKELEAAMSNSTTVSEHEPKASKSKGDKGKNSKKKADTSKSKKSAHEDLFDGSDLIDDTVNNALPLDAVAVDDKTSKALETPAPLELELPNEPFVSSEDKQSDTLPGMDSEIADFNNEPLNIGSFINSMTNFSARVDDVKESKKNSDSKKQDSKADLPVNNEIEDYGENFNYEEEREKGNFTENDEIYALYELLKQTRDFGEDEDNKDKK